MPWQAQALREFIGTINLDTGKRQYTEAYWQVPKKNGKSFVVAGLPIYLLDQDDEPKAEHYGAAAAKDQAVIVFRHAAAGVNSHPDLKARFKIIESTKRIVRRDGAGFYQVLSADGDVQDGIEPAGAVKDEVHRWKTAKAHVLDEVLSKGMISRSEPVEIKITTPGEIFDSPLAYAEYERARMVKAGLVSAPHLHVMIHEADQERLRDDKEYWKSREARVSANPSHVDRGGFLPDEGIVRELEKALINPGKKPEYLRYHLGIWVDAGDPWIDLPKWRACLPTRSTIGRNCFVGVDLSATEDFTAIVLLFPDSDGTFDVKPFFFVPEERQEWLEARTKMPIRSWVDRGLMIAPHGDKVDYPTVRKHLRWIRDEFQILNLGYDVRYATDVIEQGAGEEDGIPITPISQNASSMTLPMTRINDMLSAGQIRHDNHEVLNWHAACLDGKETAAGIVPMKPDRRKHAKRIDGMSALMNALRLALVAADNRVMDPIQ